MATVNNALLAAIVATVSAASFAAGKTAPASGVPARVLYEASDGGEPVPAMLQVEALCDGVDNDHDGRTDEGYHVGDGCAVGVGRCAPHGTEPLDGVIVCSDDHRSSVCVANPDPDCRCAPRRGPVAEVCNKVDDDCNGQADEGENDANCRKFYRDDDHDGHGTADVKCLCKQVAPYTALSSDDCDDSNAKIHDHCPTDGGR